MANSDAFYIEIRDEAEALIAEYGALFPVRGEGVYDPALLTKGAGAQRSVTGVVADQATAKSLAGGTESAWVGAKTLLLSASANIKENEDVDVSGKWYPLSKVVELKPADILVVYMLDVS